jgi:hypothetical protein
MTSLSRWLRKAFRAARLPAFMHCWLLPCWCLLGLSRLLLWAVPFGRLKRWLGSSGGDAPWVPLATDRQMYLALQIGRTIRLAARCTPWESACLPQALAARWLLGLHRVPYALYLGWRRGAAVQGEAAAHAWVAVGRVRVTGGAGFPDYAVLGTFVAPRLAAT